MPLRSTAPTAALALCALTGALSACGTYEPPKPGVHRGPGEPRAEIVCGYETPTASRFVQLRCDRREDAKARTENQQREIDNTRPAGPLIQ